MSKLSSKKKQQINDRSERTVTNVYHLMEGFCEANSSHTANLRTMTWKKDYNTV
jgi:hypothetical protein